MGTPARINPGANQVSSTTAQPSAPHFYASPLIRHGESVKTVQARLGHASAVETLNTYGHLWPDADDRTRDAVAEVLGNLARPVRGLETA